MTHEQAAAMKDVLDRLARAEYELVVTKRQLETAKAAEAAALQACERMPEALAEMLERCLHSSCRCVGFLRALAPHEYMP